MKYPYIISSLFALALLGAGCQLPSRATGTVTPTPVEAPKLAKANGFGKLPTFDGSVPLGNPATRSAMAISSIAPVPVSAPPAVGTAVNVPVDEKATASMVARPYPIPPPPQTPGTVSYDVTGAIPTWSATGDVLRARPMNAAAAQISLLAQATGLPTQTIGSGAQAQSLSFSWKDADGFTWSYDAVQRNVSFWKQDDRVYASGEEKKTPPKIDDAEFIRIAQDFLASKGLATIPHADPIVEKPWGDVAATDAVRMPCPVLMMGTTNAKAEPASVVSSEPAVVKPDIAPGEYYPCSFPIQTTVTFPSVRNGREIRDVSGWPIAAMTVTIDNNSKLVMGGYGWLDRDTDASSYALIDRDAAIKRLKSGGRNPIWPWGDGTDVTVKITSVELVWMRYDSWNDKDGNATYFIPALAGTGTVEYEKGQTQPYYHTVVPLVADDSFEPMKPPEPMPLGVEAGGGSGGSAPAATGVVTPLKE